MVLCCSGENNTDCTDTVKGLRRLVQININGKTKPNNKAGSNPARAIFTNEGKG